MRSFVTCFAALVTATAVAHADPVAVTTTDATPRATDAAPATSGYIAGGLEGGGTDEFITLGGRVELGTRVAPYLSVHGLLAEGGLGRMFATGGGTYTQLRAGADVTGCSSGGALCIFAGADVGYQHASWTGHDNPLFGPADPDPVDMTIEHDQLLGVARLGLDIGGTNVRWRPSIEASIADDGETAFTGTQSIAYRF